MNSSSIMCKYYYCSYVIVINGEYNENIDVFVQTVYNSTLFSCMVLLNYMNNVKVVVAIVQNIRINKELEIKSFVVSIIL